MSLNTLPNPQSFPGLRRNLRPRNWAGPVVLFALGLTVFGVNLASEPHFVDESAYISQSFYADLWTSGDWNNPAWLTYAGYDLPPLPKYVIGWSLKAHGTRRPTPSAMFAWYRDTSQEFVTPAAHLAARWPSVVLGALGCVAIYVLGTLAWDDRVGWLAGLLLMANPLYGLHARRAMSDIYAEAFILCTSALGLWAWKRLLGSRSWTLPFLGLSLGCGILAGLATLSKLNGSLAGFILGSWTVLAFGLPGIPNSAKLRFAVATILSGVVAFGTFVAFNPFLYAHPRAPNHPSIAPVAAQGFWERVKVISDHRVNVSEQAKSIFPKDALTSPVDKWKALVVQGFGRFGPFGPRGRSDSTVRYDWDQDRGALLWLPLVALGLVSAIFQGRRQFRQGAPPTSWAVAIQAIVTTIIVTSFIPLAWDRYFLSIQPGFAILGGFAIVGTVEFVRSLWSRKSVSETFA